MNEINDKMRIGCIGCGVMGTALIRSIHSCFPQVQIIVSDSDIDKAQKFANDTGCLFAQTNDEVIKTSSYVFLAVKPQFMQVVLQKMDNVLSTINPPIFISIAAGLTLQKLQSYIPPKTPKKISFIRLMPNLPAIIGQAMIGLCAENNIDKTHIAIVKELLSGSGIVEEVSEKLMDGVTAVSGSGPAYGFIFIEALADAAVRCGIPRSQAIIYAAQTLKGAASMVLETKRHPAELKDAVCSPAGTTIEGVKVLEQSGFRSAIIDAVDAAWCRSKELS